VYASETYASAPTPLGVDPHHGSGDTSLAHPPMNFR